jgi:metal-responsive CopG/Arc/MetJ family transcriptional regulator
MRLNKKVAVAIPCKLLIQIDQLADLELRTRNEIIREAVRKYLHSINEANKQ